MINKKLMIFAIFLLSLLAVSAVSAADNVTDDVVGVEETTDEAVSLDNDDQVILEETNVGTFTDLVNEIAKAKGELNLNKNYKYTSSDSDYKEGIAIEKSIVINGNGHTINGNNQARIFNVRAEVVLNNIYFVNGNANDAGGGAIFFSGDGADSVLSDCSFENCVAEYGGAICCYCDNVNLQDCIFMSSYSTDGSGGAIYWDAADGTVSGCSFVNCAANGGGGSVCWFGEDGVLTDCYFENSYSTSGAGAVHWGNFEGGGFLSDCCFVNCSSDGTGGAVSWRSDNGVLSDCCFVNCSSDGDGGAVYLHGDNGVLSGCSFVNSFSTDSGGAVYFSADHGVLANCSFINSSSKYYGGAVYWAGMYGKYYTGSDGVLANCSFVNSSSNHVDTSSSGSIWSYGGAVYWAGPSGLLANCSFVNSSCFTSGSAGSDTSSYSYGGAVYWSGDNGVLENCSFVNSISSSVSTSRRSYSYGGAVYWRSYGGGVLANCSFVNSICSSVSTSLSSVSYGGAVYWDDFANGGVLRDCTFINSISKSVSHSTSHNYEYGSYGGAVYWEANDGSVVESIFINCRADAGSGIYFKGTNCSLIFATFEDGSYWYSENPLVVIDKLSSVISAPDVSTIYGASKNLVATLKDANNKVLAGEEITFLLNNKEQTLTTNSKGQASLAIPTNLAPNTYIATITYNGKGKYNSSYTTAKVTVNKLASVVTAEDVTVKYGDANGKFIATLTNDKGTPLSANIVINLNGVNYALKTNSKGQASVSTADLAPGEYKATVTYKGNSKYAPSSATAKVIIVTDKLVSVVSADDVTVKYGDASGKFIATLTNAAGVPLSANIIINLNGKDYSMKTNSKGQGSVSTAKLAQGEYTATVTYKGNSKYAPSTTTAKVTVKFVSVVSASDVTVKYGDANGKFIATLTNAEGTPLSANIVINLNGVNYALKTNSKGQASVSTAKLKVGEYTATVTYKGNSKYAPSSTTAKVIVTDKLISKVSAEDVTVDYGDANGKFIATLTNAAGVPLSANIVINLNGVNYAMKTNSKGQASVSTKDLEPGEYKATVTYKGNSKYAPSTTTAKVTVRAPTKITGTYNAKTKEVIGTLTNGDGVPLSANVVVSLNGVNHALKSDSKGQFKVSAADLAPGSYTAKLVYKGNSKYGPSSATVKVVIP